MRKISVFLFVVLCVRMTYAQDIFTVVKVSGNIVIERTGSPLGTGTSFAQNESLIFKLPDSRALVRNSQRGQFLITSQKYDEFKNSKSNYLPSAAKISTRAIGISSRRDALKNEFEGNFVFLNENKILVDELFFPMSAKEYFYIMYNYKDRTINKKLAFINDTLIIKRDELLTVDGTMIPDPKIDLMDLMYIKEGVTNGTTIICHFTPVFPDYNILSKETKIILDQMEMNPYGDKIREIISFVKEFYGKVDENSLKKWLKDNFNLKP